MTIQAYDKLMYIILYLIVWNELAYCRLEDVVATLYSNKVLVVCL
jgi:hypothetical protein